MLNFIYKLYLRACSYTEHYVTTKHVIIETKFNRLTQRYEFTHVQRG